MSDAVRPPPPAASAPPFRGQGPAVAVIAVGGALGAVGRHGLDLALPLKVGAFPLATFLINVTGCLLIGALVVVLTELVAAPSLVRPFLVTGVLGGYTTFSTYTVQTQALLAGGRVGTALAYLCGTLAAALAATWAGMRLARALGSRRAR